MSPHSRRSRPVAALLRLLSAAALFGVLLAPAPAAAQGFLDLLFGSPKPPPIALPAPKPLRTSPGSSGGSVFPSDARSSRTNGDAEGGGGTYRTLCVRMCDGYFVPMSFSTTRVNFMQDQVRCRATCGDDARLFYHRNPGGNMEDAIDLSGRVYGRQPNAFRYRKALVEGCACRPPPWSDAEKARHLAYAVGPQSPVVGQPLSPASKTADAASVPGAPAGPADATLKLAKPEPVLQPARSRTASQKREVPGTQQVAARAVPQPRAAAAPPGADGGLFGLGVGLGMGTGPKPKYRWPGD